MSDFLHKETAKICENHQRSFKKYYFDFWYLKKKSRYSIPFTLASVLIEEYLEQCWDPDPQDPHVFGPPGS
jgi:hypothetical protein